MRALPLSLLFTLSWPLAACDSGRVASSTSTPAEQPAMHDPATNPSPTESALALHPELAAYVAEVVAEVPSVPGDRKARLDELAAFVESQREAGETAKLTFICTHNSRRSHLSQLWAATAAAYYGIDHVETYSGGTEATAFNPRAVAAMKRAGFHIEAGEGDNPRYQVSFSPDAPAQPCFSKKYDDEENPSAGFAAVMTCSHADESCPVVFGAQKRVAIPYVDPTEADDTPEEAATYDARSRQIALEMFYLFSRVHG